MYKYSWRHVLTSQSSRKLDNCDHEWIGRSSGRGSWRYWEIRVFRSSIWTSGAVSSAKKILQAFPGKILIWARLISPTNRGPAFLPGTQTVMAICHALIHRLTRGLIQKVIYILQVPCIIKPCMTTWKIWDEITWLQGVQVILFMVRCKMPASFRRTLALYYIAAEMSGRCCRSA